jgi:hypothetical protein
MGVTNIKSFHNQSSNNVQINKREDGNDSIALGPDCTSAEEIWIPWCTNPEEFKRKVMTVEITSGRTYYIWQNGSKVRCSASETWQDPGQAILGEPRVDGERRLVIQADGNPRLDII